MTSLLPNFATELAALVVVKASLVVVFATALTWTLRRAGATTRSACWTAFGIALLVLPAASLVVPRVAVPLPVSAVVPEWFDARSAADETQRQDLDDSPRAVARSIAPTAPRATVTVARWIPTTLIAVWLLGALLLVAGLIRAMLGARAIRRRARPIDAAAFGDQLDALVLELGVRRRPIVAVSSAVRVPVTGGLLRAYVLLPDDYAAWSPERLRAVLVHELTHVVRWDYAVHLLFEIVRAFYWPNPLGWRAMTNATAERELAADDSVLTARVAPTAYAADLLAFATAALQRGTARATVGVAPSALKRRIRAILRDDVRRDTPTRRRVVGIGTAAAAGLALVAPLSAARTAIAHVAKTARQAAAMVVATPAERPKARHTHDHHEPVVPTIGDTRDDSLLAILFLDQTLERRTAAAHTLVTAGSRDTVVRTLLSSFTGRCFSDRYRAARALRELHDEDAVPDLVGLLLSDRHSAVRAMLANAIASSGAARAAPLLRSALTGQPNISFDRVGRAIDTLGDTAAHARLLDALREARRRAPTA